MMLIIKELRGYVAVSEEADQKKRGNVVFDPRSVSGPKGNTHERKKSLRHILQRRQRGGDVCLSDNPGFFSTIIRKGSTFRKFKVFAAFGPILPHKVQKYLGGWEHWTLNYLILG